MTIITAHPSILSALLTVSCTLSLMTLAGVSGPCYHLKLLVPAVAAGAIIGKGGETIAQLQKEAGSRVKMSKANDFYPG